MTNRSQVRIRKISSMLFEITLKFSQHTQMRLIVESIFKQQDKNSCIIRIRWTMSNQGYNYHFIPD